MTEANRKRARLARQRADAGRFTLGLALLVASITGILAVAFNYGV